MILNDNFRDVKNRVLLDEKDLVIELKSNLKEYNTSRNYSQGPLDLHFRVFLLQFHDHFLIFCFMTGISISNLLNLYSLEYAI